MKEKQQKIKQRIKQVKDKEGILFEIVLNPSITEKNKKRTSVIYVKSFIEKKLELNKVYPINNRVGFTGDIDSVSYFMAGIIESFLDFYFIENQLDIK